MIMRGFYKRFEIGLLSEENFIWELIEEGLRGEKISQDFCKITAKNAKPIMKKSIPNFFFLVG
jgi:hypothetical protein